MLPNIRTRLEVIVTTVEEAREAEAGGADCLEIVKELQYGGLTPDLPLLQQILSAISVPARAMLRSFPSSEVADLAGVEQLVLDARAMGTLPVEGLVLGFVENGKINLDVLRKIAEAAPNVPFTFHRAFEELSDPFAAIQTLKELGQVNRILVSIADSERGPQLADLKRWQTAAGPAIQFIAGIGLRWDLLHEVVADPALHYVHVGRFAREGHRIGAAVSRAQVADLKSAFA